MAYADGLVCLNESADWLDSIDVQTSTRDFNLGNLSRCAFHSLAIVLRVCKSDEEFHLRRELDDDSVLDEFPSVL